MSKLKINPEDFVFQSLPFPDERKTLLEYDAKNRIILLRTKDEDGKIAYNSVFISKEINENILKNIPDEWSNDNDRILLFAIYEDGEYILEKEKIKYDFSTKSTKWVRYSFRNLTIRHAKELYEILKAAIFVDDEIKKYNNISSFLELSKKTYYLNQFKEKNDNLINKLLRETDWRILPDYPEQFENEISMWVLWRSKLRELNLSPSDFEDSLDYMIHLEEIKWPIRPDQYNSKYPEHTPQYLETDDQFVDNLEIIDNKNEDEYIKTMLTYREILNKYQQDGITISSAMSERIKKYNLIKDLKEFKDIKFTEEN